MRLQHQWTTLQKITSVLKKSFKNILRLVILMFLLIFLFAIIGNRILGSLYDYENDFNRLRYYILFLLICLSFGIFIKEFYVFFMLLQQ